MELVKIPHFHFGHTVLLTARLCGDYIVFVPFKYYVLYISIYLCNITTSTQ